MMEDGKLMSIFYKTHENESLQLLCFPFYGAFDGS